MQTTTWTSMDVNAAAKMHQLARARMHQAG
jgi:hypothetical protein